MTIQYFRDNIHFYIVQNGTRTDTQTMKTVQCRIDVESIFVHKHLYFERESTNFTHLLPIEFIDSSQLPKQCSFNRTVSVSQVSEMAENKTENRNNKL